MAETGDRLLVICVASERSIGLEWHTAGIVPSKMTAAPGVHVVKQHLGWWAGSLREVRQSCSVAGSLVKGRVAAARHCHWQMGGSLPEFMMVQGWRA